MAMLGQRSGGDTSPMDRLVNAAKAYAADPNKYLDQVAEIERRREELRGEEVHLTGLRAEHAEHEKRIKARDTELHATANELAQDGAGLRTERAGLDRGKAALEEAGHKHGQAVEAATIKLAAERRDLDSYKAQLDDRDKAQVKRADELDQAEADLTQRQGVVAEAERRIRAFAETLGV